ncbi:hypothetical protein J437_LFUL000119 [Ladona fulva]|uniref:Atg6 BARA domain-containing protein n=1 Tax=Ladona fulva TaxID=123851 RepID=A0A8K0K5K0_LADFU|nr:hypothetical protein J437_LFUL000119 [Ladona fulva]
MVEPKITVNFLCQRCLQPLKLDPAFSNLDQHTLNELSLPIYPAPDVDLESQATSLDHYIPPFRLTESGNAASGFMLIGDEGEAESLSHHVKVTAGLFDILSNTSDVDHPLCEECTDSLLDLMDQQLRLTEDEWNDYNEYLKSMILICPMLLRLEELRLQEDLKQLQAEEAATLESIRKHEEERDRLEREEERYYREYSRHRRELLLTEDEFRSLGCQLHYAQTQLDKLKKTNVFNVTFHIWHSGHFGTINNFRLGRLPSAPVDWSEINAAWGQTALLLAALARKMNLTFQRFRLVPYGNHSYIEVCNI